MWRVLLMGIALGFIYGFHRGAIFGRHHARGLRSWRDAIGYKNAIPALLHRAWDEWTKTIGGFVLALVIVAVLGVMVFVK